MATQGGDSTTAKELSTRVQSLTQLAFSKIGQENFQR
jgi:hypothetical protein